MKKNILSLILISMLSSCVFKEKCTIPRIPENVLDITDLDEGRIVFRSGNDTTNLLISNKWDSYEEESISALANKVDCHHSIGYECSFQNENIIIELIKDENENLTLYLFSRFNTDRSEIKTNEDQIRKQDNYIFNQDRYNSTQIKQVILRGVKVESIKTVDNKTWKP